MNGLGIGLRLARMDVTRMIRRQTSWRDSATSVLGLLLYAVLLLGGTLGGTYVGLRVGEAVTTGGGLPELGPFGPVEIVRGLLALFWLMISLVYTLRFVGQRGELAQPEGVLTVVSTRQALLGHLLAEYVYYLLWLLPPAIGFGLGLSLGAGTMLPLFTVPLAVVAAGISSVAIGWILGLSIRHIASRFEFVARHKGLLIIIVFVGYFIALSTGAWNELMVQLFEPMQRSPVGWYADLLVLGIPGFGASPIYAGAGLALSAVLALLGLSGGTWIADRHWFSDPALPSAESEKSVGVAGEKLDRRLAPSLGPATASLVTLSWRRAKRSPMKLLYGFYPMLILAGLFANIIQTGEVPSYLPLAVLVFVTWAAGVIFTLNPLGDQGAALPSTLLSHVDGRTFVRAHVLAGLVIAVPLGTAVTGLVAVLSPINGRTAVALTVATPVLMLVSATFSIGIGMAFPRFEATRVTKSMKTVLPSRWAFVLFSLYLFGAAAAAAVVFGESVRTVVAGLLSWLLTWALPVVLNITPETLRVVGLVALVPLLVAPIPAYRYAVRRFDAYTLA